MKYLRPIFLLLVLSALGLRAELSLPPVFTDNMVLQRNGPVPVWGQAAPGAQVTVSFTGQNKPATADAAGHWRVTLDPLPANAEPQILEVVESVRREQSVVSSLRYTNVLVGEVWLAAGQSNMEFPLSRETHAAAELPAATNNSIRLLNLTFSGQYFYSRPFAAREADALTPEHFYQGTWQDCSPAVAKGFSAIAYYFGRDLRQDLNVPVGLIHCAIGGSPTEAWIRRGALEQNPGLAAMLHGNWLTNTVLDDWCRQRGRENLNASLTAGVALPGDDAGPNHPFKPGFLWAAGPARLAPFAVRGVLWYQGESNSLEERRVRQHEILFPLLVRDWRAAWGQDLPWLYCQLSSIRTNSYQSAGWPEFRDQQRRFLATIPRTGMAVTSDHGAPGDVHPREKREIGRRLALIARAQVYGDNVESSGPVPLRAEAKDAVATVFFSHAAGLAGAEGQGMHGFELAGRDGLFHPAEAVPAAAAVQLAAPGVSHPCRVRYGWQPFSEGNLVNAAALPASTFELTVAAP